MRSVALTVLGLLLLVYGVDAYEDCDPSTGICSNVACGTSEDCAGIAENLVCEVGICQCAEGYSQENDECTKVIGRACAITENCDLAHMICDQGDNVCACDHSWYEEGGVCVSLIGKSCLTTSDCLSSTNYWSNLRCINSSCDCQSGYMEVNGLCEYILWRHCEGDEDCPLENAWCYGGNQCQCKPGTVQSYFDNTCVYKIGGSCDKIYCYDDYLSFCDDNNECRCRAGYVEESHYCVHVLGRACNTFDDCGGYNAFSCSADDTCSCADGFQLGYDGYDQTCVTTLGSSCNTPDDCSIVNAECDLESKCNCVEGFVDIHGACEPVLEATCYRDETCHVLDHTHCGKSGKCECLGGFVMENNHCVQVLHSLCTEDEDCISAFASCTDGLCACDEPLVEHNGLCLREACATDVKQLSDLHRRDESYSSALDTFEPPIDDSTFIDEGWHSLGQWNLLSSPDSPGIGKCGTYYPIYATGDVTVENGEEVERAFIVGGTNETINVRLRKCGYETHVFPPSSMTKFSAFCTGGSPTWKPLHSSSSAMWYVHVNPSLLFQEVVIDNEPWHTPYILFSCHCSHCYSRYNLVNWYANRKHLSSEIVQSTDMGTLSEDMLISAGYKAGVELLCSIQAMEERNAKPHQEIFSNPFNTGFNDEWTGHLSPGIKQQYPYRFSHATPFGCATPDSDRSLTCKLDLDIVTEDEQSSCVSAGVSDGDEHPLCGLTLMGLTYWGSQQHYDPYYLDDNGISTTFGAHVFAKEDDDHRSSNIFKTKFKSIHDGDSTWSPVHEFWKGVTPPDRYFQVSSPTAMPTADYSSCWVSDMNGFYTPSLNVQSFSETGFGYESWAIEQAGEFELFYHTESPLQVQIKTENHHDDTWGSAIRVCAATIRYGNKLFTRGFCDGVKSEGFLSGVSGYEPFPDSFNVHPYHIWMGQSSGTGSMYVSISSNDGFGAIEGLCAATANNYPTRTGGNSREKFLESWKLPWSESLLNPDNQLQVAWNETHYLCGCPDKSDNITNRILQWRSEEQEHYYEYTGALECSLDTECTTEHSGREWKNTLLPDYTIKEVTVSGFMDETGGVMALFYFCNFRTVEGYYYGISWSINGEMVSSVSQLTAADVANEYLRIDSSHGFSLDSEVTCGVSVLSSEGDILLDNLTSEEFIAVEIITAEISMARASDAILLLRINIHLFGEACFYEITLYDIENEDCNCKDSSIAVKTRSDRICGTRIRGKAKSQQVIEISETMIQITITNKNNKKYSLKDVFRLRLIAVGKCNGVGFIKSEFRQIVTVFIRDEGFWMRQTCYANNDPRCRTFDGTYYYCGPPGTYLFYRYTKGPYEVQLIVTYCNGGWTCSCGVIIRAGLSVFIINHCHGEHMTGFLREDSAESLLVVWKLSDNRYQFWFPHGTIIDVTISPWRWFLVNVNIYPSPADVNNVEGLCGHFNGNPADDLLDRYGLLDRNEPDRTWWWFWYYYPEDFMQSWRLDGEWEIESLLIIDNVYNLQDWDDPFVLCVCPGNHESEDSICSVNEDDTCTEPVDVPGEKVQQSARGIRSDQTLNWDIERRLKNTRSKLAEAASSMRVKRSTSETSMDPTSALEKVMVDFTADCDIFNLQEEFPDNDFNGTLVDITLDTAANPDVSWTQEGCSRLQVELEMEITKNEEFQDEARVEVKDKITKKCLGNCSNGNGVCEDGKCRCLHGFTREECTVDITLAPSIQGVHGDGVCNKATDGSCTCFIFTTSGIADAATCKITINAAFSNTGKFVQLQQFETPAHVLNMYELYCCVNHDSRRKRSTSGDTELGQSYEISLSNDNTTFGNSESIYVLDSSCQEIGNDTDGNIQLLLKAGYCYIDGTCYAEGITNGALNCSICDPSTNLFDWKDTCQTNATAPGSTSGSNDDDDNTKFVIIVSVVGVSVLAICVAVAVSVKIFLNKKQIVVPEPGLYNTSTYEVANKRFVMRKEIDYSAWM